VHEDNLHIIPDPLKGFPAPEIPADEAWSRMALLLDAEIPQTPETDPSSNALPNKPKASGLITGGSHMWGIAVVGVGLASAVLWGTMLLKKSFDAPVKDKNTELSQNNIVISDTILSENNRINENEELAEAKKTIGIQVSKSFVPDVLEQKELTELTKATNSKNSVYNSVSTPGIETKKCPEKAVLDPAAEARLIAPESNIVIAPVRYEEQERNKATGEDTIVNAFIASPDTQQNQKPAAGIELQIANNTFPDTGNNSRRNPDSGKITENSSKSPRNLIWQCAVSGNLGHVYQKERNKNTYYGCFITGGLKNLKLSAGIETGIGIGNYKDYGTIENTWLKMDSIITQDTIWHTVDSILIPEIIDTTIYYPVTNHDTITYNYDYTYLQIPFFITKQIADFGRVSLDIKAGPQVGFLISTNESVTHSNISASGELTGRTNKKYTRLDISWQLLFAPQIRWDISDNLSFGMSPSITLFLNNLYEQKNRPDSMPYGLSVYGSFIYNFR